MQLEQAALPGPVGRVRLEATLTAPLENRQGELFAGNQHEAARQFALLIDRSSSRLGPDAVLRPAAHGRSAAGTGGAVRVGGQESGVRSQEVQGAGYTRSGLSSKFKVCGKQIKTLNLELRNFELLPSPPTCRFIRPPLPLDVLSISPDGPPVSFRFQGQQHQVAALLRPGANRNRLVARQKRPPRLLARRNHHRPALLALPQPRRPASGICTESSRER